MNLINQIKNEMTINIKNSNRKQLTFSRLLVSELEKEKVNLKLKEITDLTDEQVTNVLIKYVKILTKNIKTFEGLGKDVSDLVEEKEYISKYINRMSETEIDNLIDRVVELHHFGLLTQHPMAFLTSKLGGSIDAREIKSRLSDRGIKL